MSMVEMHNVTKKFKTITAVDEISLSIPKGEIYGLLGPNGAGKSTTISMVSTLMKPTSGELTVGGYSVIKNPAFVRKQIGLVPQDIALYPTLTACENLKFFGRMNGIYGKQLNNKVAEVLEVVGLKERARDRIESFSGGMKRRINIAAGLMNDPELLILDEPTVGIDPQSRNHILETVKKLNQQGITILYTSHYMEEVEFLCTHIAIIDHGKLIATGTQESLKNTLGQDDQITVAVADLQDHQLDVLRSIIGKGTFTYEDGILTVSACNTRAILKDLVSTLSNGSTQITSIQFHEPNLETVFLQLTGRALRD